MDSGWDLPFGMVLRQLQPYHAGSCDLIKVPMLLMLEVVACVVCPWFFKAFFFGSWVIARQHSIDSWSLLARETDKAVKREKKGGWHLVYRNSTVRVGWAKWCITDLSTACDESLGKWWEFSILNGSWTGAIVWFRITHLSNKLNNHYWSPHWTTWEITKSLEIQGTIYQARYFLYIIVDTCVSTLKQR